MRRKLKVFLAAFLLTFLLCSPTFAQSQKQDSLFTEIYVYVNDKKVKFDEKPFIENSRTLVPIRFIAETLGYQVEWNEKNQKVTIKNEKHNMILFIGQNRAIIDGKEKILDVAACTKNNRTFVPLRFVSENFDREVKWEETKNSNGRWGFIYINTRGL